ncbi:FadR/GntR family transcriptional regulator [Fictibacillus sp. NRS-1165]|uniref:FadR/GntR family transcriptional regulator n=1 Tax=Fictibacillus sp. NRS-1165 TaxID=3144463 RepID=UPI003D20EB85
MIKKEKASQKISRELLNMIDSEVFPPGSKLPTEKELSAHFGVSRIPIREALSVLRAAGIISSRQGGGSYVEEGTAPSLLQRLQIQSDDVEGIKYLFEMRRILEPQAAYLAAERRTPEDLAKMKQWLKVLKEESINEGKTGREADIEFHRLVILATHNPIFIQMFENLSSLYKSVLSVTLQPNKELKFKRETVYKEHQNILNAIEDEEPDLARIQSTIHLKNAEKKLSVFLQDYDL